MTVSTFSILKWNHFYATINGIIKQTCELFHKKKYMNIPVKIFRSDNAGENNML